MRRWAGIHPGGRRRRRRRWAGIDPGGRRRRRRRWAGIDPGGRRRRRRRWAGIDRGWHDDAGVVAGAEALPFGVLVFVIGTLVVANAWGVIDAKFAVAAAAREAARAYVEAETGDAAYETAVSAASAALAAQGRDPSRMRHAFSGRFARCSRVSWTVSYTVPAVTMPWVGGFGGGITARATHSEIVDPLRTGVPGEATCVDTG